MRTKTQLVVMAINVKFDETDESSIFSNKCIVFFQMCMSHVSRPIKRGQIFGNMAPRKPQLSRHFKNMEFIFNIHEFEVYYWVSFAKQNGVEMQGKNFQMTVGM